MIIDSGCYKNCLDNLATCPVGLKQVLKPLAQIRNQLSQRFYHFIPMFLLHAFSCRKCLVALSYSPTHTHACGFISQPHPHACMWLYPQLMVLDTATCTCIHTKPYSHTHKKSYEYSWLKMCAYINFWRKIAINNERIRIMVIVPA